MQLIDRVVSWDNHLIDSISNSLYFQINTWLASHPFVHWLVDHFMVAIILGSILIILLIRLVLTIYHSVASTIDRMWLWVLRSPFALLKLLFGWEVKSKDNPANTTITNYEITHNSDQLQEIMARLEHIQQQQGQIVRQIALLKEQSFHVDAKKIDLKLSEKELPSSITEE